MVCRECGIDIEAGRPFCSNCGEATAASDAVADATEGREPPTPSVDAEELIRRAVQADLRGNLEAAVALAEDAVSADPANARARSLLAGLYERLGRTDEAITQYEAALSLDPGNQLDRLRLRRLSPERADALAAPLPRDEVAHDGTGAPLSILAPAASTASERSSVERRRRTAIIAASAVLSAGLVVAVGLLGWRLIVKPRVAMDETQVASSEQGPGVLLARARGAKLEGDYERARQLAYQVLAEDPDNAEARALLSELSTSDGTSSIRGSDLADAVFPGEGSTSASGALLGLQAGYEAGAGLPTAPILAELPPATGAPPGIVSYGPLGGVATSINPAQPQATGTLSSLPSIDSAYAPPAQQGNIGNLMGNVSGGMSNAGVTPLLPSGPSRSPGTMRPGAMGSPAGSDGGAPVMPQPQPPQGGSISGYPAQAGPSSVRPGSTGGTVGQPQGSVRVAQPQGGGSTMSMSPSGGTVPRGTPSLGGSGVEDEAWRLQSEGTRLAQSGDKAGAIRALQAADARWAESNAPSAAAARESIRRQLGFLQEE